MIITETNRLILREFVIEDAKLFYALNENPEVLKYTGDLPFDNIDEAKNFIVNYSSYSQHGFGRWAVVLKEDNRFVGWCGLKLNEEGFIDIGFRFFEEEWGQGYASESAKAVLEFGFTVLNLDEIIGRVATENIASVKVLEKLNMQYWKKEICKGIENASYYKITFNQYRAKE